MYTWFELHPELGCTHQLEPPEGARTHSYSAQMNPHSVCFCGLLQIFRWIQVNKIKYHEVFITTNLRVCSSQWFLTLQKLNPDLSDVLVQAKFLLADLEADVAPPLAADFTQGGAMTACCWAEKP